MTIENNSTPIETIEEYENVIQELYRRAGMNANEPTVTIELPLTWAQEVFDVWADNLFKLEDEHRETIDPVFLEETAPVIEQYNQIYDIIQGAINEADTGDDFE
jgi:hypothetical protein